MRGDQQQEDEVQRIPKEQVCNDFRSPVWSGESVVAADSQALHFSIQG